MGAIKGTCEGANVRGNVGAIEGASVGAVEGAVGVTVGAIDSAFCRYLRKNR